jgi:4-alpha-glucanotransferase
LLHPTSLPSPYGIGDLGPAAFAFADRLAKCHQGLWQVLPLGPVGHGASPYSSPSTFAGNPLLISPKRLLDRGLVTPDEVAPLEALPSTRVDYARLLPRKQAVLRSAFDRFDADASAQQRDAFEHFQQREAAWLTTYALYMALKNEHDGAPWTDWGAGLVQRAPDALHDARERLARERRMHAFWQYLFDRQWTSLRAHCHDHSIRLFGDLPIYVAHDSADVWGNRSLFHLAPDGSPTVVAGVPPDYFSPEGQRWGNPIYRWDRMRENGYAWWIRRFRKVLERVDLVRLDHFRGFEAFWEIPATADTAIDGEWRDGPGADLFHALDGALDALPVVAEDLGVITEPVRALRDRFGFPGMAVLQFAFNGDPTNAFLPHNYQRRLVAYPGTHDNNTLRGWWTDALDGPARRQARVYLDLGTDDDLIDRSLRMLMASRARRVVSPLQDVLGLGAEARMNTPGKPRGNWAWRYTPGQFSTEALDRLRTLTRAFGRAASQDTARDDTSADASSQESLG